MELNKRKYSLDTEKLIQNSKERIAKVRASREKFRQTKENTSIENQNRKHSKSNINSNSNSTMKSIKKHDKIPVRSDEFILIHPESWSEIITSVQKEK